MSKVKVVKAIVIGDSVYRTPRHAANCYADGVVQHLKLRYYKLGWSGATPSQIRTWMDSTHSKAYRRLLPIFTRVLTM